jgi:acyl-CoA thioesterase
VRSGEPADVASTHPDEGGMEHLPCPFTARATWAGELVAESSSAVRVEQAGEPPFLLFPMEDVRLGAFRRDESAHPLLPVEGGEVWSAEETASGRGTVSKDWRRSAADSADGAGVLHTFTNGPVRYEWLAGLATFDHRRVDVELVDPMGGVDSRSVTVKRFPTWGDASHLIDILDVSPAGPGRYRGVPRAGLTRSVVEGSQMLGQAIVAAGRHAPGRRTVSASMVFVRAADAAVPLTFEIEDVSAGRTFTTLAVDACQADRRCGAGTMLLDVTAPDVIRHSVAAPDVPGPYACEPYDMSVTGRDIRVVEGTYTDDPDTPVGPPVIDAWVRFRDVPDDPLLHAGLLAQFTGHMSIAAAMRPHPGVGQSQSHRTLSTAINAISLSFHADVHADRWMLYHHRSTFAGDGMTRSECRVHDEDGHLLASFSVDAMVRGFGQQAVSPDDRRTL